MLDGVIMRLFNLIFYFFIFVPACFAYNIEPCSKYVSNNKVRGVLNIVFCPLNYQDSRSFGRDRQILIKKLKATKPFDEFNVFRFWYIDISKKEESFNFRSTQGFPPLKVRQDFLDSIKARLKSNYKLVIIDAKGFTSCAELSSVSKLSLIILGRARYGSSDSFARGFLHEFGHSFGLRDECVDCRRCSGGPPNCARTKEEAERLWGDLAAKYSRVRYIQGCCGSINYIRPTTASLMNNPDRAKDFGPVNERYLRKALKAIENNSTCH